MRALAPALALLFAVAAARAEAPAVDYLLHCQGCHLADGSGQPGAVPSLAGIDRFLRVPGGREYLVRVPGSAQAPLDDARLAALLNWIVGRFGSAAGAADFTPYGAEEVARVRRPPLADVDAVRRRLLEQLETAPP